jgi:hypothetical protein
MIPPQAAAANAKKYLHDLAPDESLTDLRLEEIKLDDERKQWLITLGYFRKRSFEVYQKSLDQDATGGIGKFLARLDTGERLIENRVYKQLSLDAETGEFISMQIREPALS